MLTALPPVLLSVIVAAFVVPSVTLPNASLVGLSESVPAATPAPDNGMLNEGFDAFEVTVTVPLALPALAGANLTEIDVVCPADNVNGVVIPLTENPLPLTES